MALTSESNSVFLCSIFLQCYMMCSAHINAEKLATGNKKMDELCQLNEFLGAFYAIFF